MIYRLAVLALVATTAYAACPNNCAGHGTCGNDDICTCYQDWLTGDVDGGDCSQRRCPFDHAWVDNPTASNTAHALKECSGKGICDRKTGECECFDGYWGKACRRAQCPNDCSGHGTCEYMKELRTGTPTWTADKFYALIFRSTLGEEFTTRPLYFGMNQAAGSTAAIMGNALKALPNRVIEDVVVTRAADTVANSFDASITFAGACTSGDQYQINVVSHTCASGCMPYLAASTDAETVDASHIAIS